MVAVVVFLDSLSEVDGGGGGFADGSGDGRGGGDHGGLEGFIVVGEGGGRDVGEGGGVEVEVEVFERGFWKRGGEVVEGGTWKGLVGGGVWRGKRELGCYCREKHWWNHRGCRKCGLDWTGLDWMDG